VVKSKIHRTTVSFINVDNKQNFPGSSLNEPRPHPRIQNSCGWCSRTVQEKGTKTTHERDAPALQSCRLGEVSSGELANGEPYPLMKIFIELLFKNYHKTNRPHHKTSTSLLLLLLLQRQNLQ